MPGVQCCSLCRVHTSAVTIRQIFLVHSQASATFAERRSRPQRKLSLHFHHSQVSAGEKLVCHASAKGQFESWSYGLVVKRRYKEPLAQTFLAVRRRSQALAPSPLESAVASACRRIQLHVREQAHGAVWGLSLARAFQVRAQGSDGGDWTWTAVERKRYW